MPPGPEASPQSKAIAERIGLLRRQRGLDFKEFAAALEEIGHELNPESWSRAERGYRAVDAADIFAAARVLDVPPAELVQPGIAEEAEKLRAELAAAREQIAELKATMEAEHRRHVDDLIHAVRSAISTSMTSAEVPIMRQFAEHEVPVMRQFAEHEVPAVMTFDPAVAEAHRPPPPAEPEKAATTKARRPAAKPVNAPAAKAATPARRSPRKAEPAVEAPKRRGRSA